MPLTAPRGYEPAATSDNNGDAGDPVNGDVPASPSMAVNMDKSTPTSTVNTAATERKPLTSNSTPAATKPKDLTVLYSSGDRRRYTGKCVWYLGITLLMLAVTVIALLAIIFSNAGKPDVCLTQNCVKTAAQLLEAIDFNVDPCDDFFQYACGSWNTKHIIPEDRSSFTTFEKLHDELQVKLKRLLETPQDGFDTNATLQAKTLYHSCINTIRIEEVGDAPLRETMERHGGWPVMSGKAWPGEQTWQVETAMARLVANLTKRVLIDIMVTTDDKNSSARVLQLDQASLGMPSREYYLNEREHEYKEAYLNFMVQVAMLLGADESTARVDMRDVLDFEMHLANVTTPQEKRHDTGAMYTKVSVRKLQEEVPELNWLLYFNSFMPMNITEEELVVSFAMNYLKRMAKLVTETRKRVVANYLLWRLILGVVPEMTQKYQTEWFEYRKVLEGVTQAKVRWEKCVKYVNDRMGLAVGRLFIKDNFNEQSKHTALEMIHNIRDAFNEILEQSEWMDDETKAVAKEKANAMNERIGYPEFLLDRHEIDMTYQGLSFDRKQYFQNILRVEHHDAQKNLWRLREPVRKDKWEQDPAVVNAFYNPNTNDIVFPAGILQPLFYSQFFPKSLNYGGIGVVIGHEITHGFDDKGRQYDKDGNLRQWWNNETIEAFRERAQCMIDQYSGYELEPFGLSINGKNTQGENIADNGGLKESFLAYQKWVERNGEEALLPGINLTHNQLFFLNYAQIWCGIMLAEEALHKIRTSVHSPGPIRVLGPLSNNKDFSHAYSCPLGSRMNPTKKCSVW